MRDFDIEAAKVRSKKMAREYYDFIICVGGDGTFNETINGVAFLEKDIFLKQFVYN